MSSRQRYVVVGVLGLAVLTALTLARGLNWTFVQLGWDDPLLLDLRDLPLTTAIGYAIGVVAAVVCLKHPTIKQLSLEVVEELSKVTWPSREETGNATVVVIVTTLICSAFLGAFDAVWLWLTDWLLGAGTAGV